MLWDWQGNEVRKKKKIPTLSKRDNNQGSVHEDGIGQMLGYSHRLRLMELYKTDTWSHRQGRVTGRKYRYVATNTNKNTAMPSLNGLQLVNKFVSQKTNEFILKNNTIQSHLPSHSYILLMLCSPDFKLKYNKYLKFGIFSWSINRLMYKCQNLKIAGGKSIFMDRNLGTIQAQLQFHFVKYKNWYVNVSTSGEAAAAIYCHTVWYVAIWIAFGTTSFQLTPHLQLYLPSTISFFEEYYYNQLKCLASLISSFPLNR